MIIIYSGGMDSTALLYEYRQHIRAAVTFNYGSKHNANEIECAKFHCNKLGIKHILIDLPFINKHFESSLLKSGADIPDGHYQDDTMRSTVVPFRNGIMLSIAAGIAESIGAGSILIANHAGDHAIYPDCRGTFIEHMSEAIKDGTYGGVKLLAPYTNLTKRDIAIRSPIDLSDHTWSCYKGGEVHCGVCGTCVERKEALYGLNDKTIYEVL